VCCAYRGRKTAQLISRIETLRFAALEFDKEDARQAGDIRAILAATGTAIGPYDVLIAGQALARSLTLITRNTREFSRVKALRIEDWEAVSSVQHLLRHPAAVLDVALQDGVGGFEGVQAVPDAFRVQDGAGAAFAAVEAAGLVDADAFNFEFLHARFEVVADFFGAFAGAVAALVALWPAVAADEDVGFEEGCWIVWQAGAHAVLR
jgi:hypothetical protein